MTLSNTLQRVIKLISKPPVNRGKPEIDLLLPWLRKRSDILRNLETDILITLMQNCTYRQVSRDDIIIKQGEMGDCFYIMLTGKASVYIDTVKSGEDQSSQGVSRYTLSPGTTVSTNATGSVVTRGATSQGTEYLDEFGASKKADDVTWAVDRTQFGKFIICFDAGTSFGEIALISDDAVRNASILADEMTDLMVIDRELFNGTLKAKQEEEYQERKSFIRKCSLFRSWSSKFRRLCEMSLRKVTLPFDSVLIKQGEPVVGLHFIVTGQGKVIVDPQLHRLQYPKLFELSDEEATNELWPRLKKPESKTKETSLREQIRVRRREGYAAAERRLATKTLTMCYVDESEIIGDTELMLGLDTYTHSVVCTTNTKVFILDNKNIERLIHKKNPHTLDKLRQIVEAKLRSRTCMRVGAQIPLYKHLLDRIQGSQHRLVPAKIRDDENKPRSVAETVADRDLMVAQLSKLFIQNKTPFIEPSVPGSLYYLTKSAERARKKSAMSLMDARNLVTNGRARGDGRLYRARSAPKRQPRSRRELERLTLSSAGKDNKQTKTGDNARSKYYGGGLDFRRPVTAFETSGKFSHGSVKGPAAENTQISGDQIQLGYNDIVNSDVKEVVKELVGRRQATNASRSKVICSMLDRRNEENEAKSAIGRPKSAPAQTRRNAADDDEADADADADDDDDDDDDDEIESFDWETSNHALRELENKLRAFYAKNGAGHGFKKSNANVIELKRFNIQGPDDVPIPGGTVYVRQRACQFAGGAVSNAAHHQHIRRYIIPKDAYRLAVRSLSAIQGKTEEQVSTRTTEAAKANKCPVVRPFSSAPRAARTTEKCTENSTELSSRIKSAPLKRNNIWS